VADFGRGLRIRRAADADARRAVTANGRGHLVDRLGDEDGERDAASPRFLSKDLDRFGARGDGDASPSDA
jgi:hypothetical protein